MKTWVFIFRSMTLHNVYWKNPAFVCIYTLNIVYRKHSSAFIYQIINKDLERWWKSQWARFTSEKAYKNMTFALYSHLPLGNNMNQIYNNMYISKQITCSYLQLHRGFRYGSLWFTLLARFNIHSWFLAWANCCHSTIILSVVI